MQKTDSWKNQVSFYRFWENEHVTEQGLTELAVFTVLLGALDIHPWHHAEYKKNKLKLGYKLLSI